MYRELYDTVVGVDMSAAARLRTKILEYVLCSCCGEVLYCSSETVDVVQARDSLMLTVGY